MEQNEMLHNITVEKLKWDSDFFGMRIGKMVFELHEIFTKEEVKKLVYDTFNENVNDFDFLDIKIPASSVCTVYHLHELGAYFINALATYHCKTMLPPTAPYNCRFATQNDLARCLEITTNSFIEPNDNTNRFNNDPFFNVDTVRRYWEAWCKNVFSGEASDGIIVYDEGNIIKGYLAYAFNSGHLQIVLNAIDRQYRRQGIYSKMVSYLLNYINKMDKTKCQLVQIETKSQLSCYPIKKLWLRLGAEMDITYNFHWHR